MTAEPRSGPHLTVCRALSPALPCAVLPGLVPASSGARKTDAVTVGPLGPERTVSRCCVFTSTAQSVLSFPPRSPGELPSHTLNPFQVGRIVPLATGVWAGGVFSRCVLSLPDLSRSACWLSGENGCPGQPLCGLKSTA